MKQLFLILLAAFCAAGIQAQDGTITGTITDTDAGETLIAAHVALVGTEFVGTTDFDGQYSFKVPAGLYSLKVTYIGFAEKVVTDIEVKAGEVTYMDVGMSAGALQLDEVVVVAAAIERTENALLMLQRKSDKIQDGISSQEMSRLATGNVASAMTKVTGASVQDGKYVVVRGLGDRYSITTLNDMPLPSIDPYRNSAQLDLIPTNLLDNIITSKTFTPDQLGTFTGGSINIKTKSFPEYQTFSVSLSTAWNTQNNFQKDFLSYEGSNLDWLGYGKKDRARPEILESDLFKMYSSQNAELEARIRGNQEAAETIDNTVRSMDMRFDTTHQTSFLDYGISVSYGNSFKTGEKSSIGFIAALSHKTNYTHRPDVLDANYFAVVNGEGFALLNSGDYSRTTSEVNPVVNGFAGVGYKFNELNSIEVKYMYNHNTTIGSTFIIGEDGQNIEAPSYKLGRALTYEERDMRNIQFEGLHVFPGLNNAELEYKANYVQAQRDEPNHRYFSSQWNSETNEHGIPLANVNDPFFFWRDLHDDILNAKVDITLPFNLGPASGNRFKLGGYYSTKDRDFNEHQYRVAKSQFATNFDGDPNTYFGPDNIGIINTEPRPNGTTRYYIGNYITQATSIRNSYSGTEDVVAFYGMFTYSPFTRLKIVAGARYETTDIAVQSKIVDTGIEEADSSNTGKIDASDILPSLNLIYALNESMNLRGSYNHTIARPNLREIAPFASFDPLIDEFFIGNPELEKTDIRNADLRWEWFMNPGEVIAVSAFYKTFDNPIVLQYLSASNPEFKYVNADKGDIKGLEFEVRKSLGFLAGGLRNFKLGANLALIRSSTDVVSAFENQEVKSRQFQGQSDVLANINLNYVNIDQKWDITLAYNYTGDRLANIGEPTETTPATDIFENSVSNLDFIASKQFGKISLKFSALNLLNPEISQYIPFTDGETLTGRYKRGITFGLSAEYKL